MIRAEFDRLRSKAHTHDPVFLGGYFRSISAIITYHQRFQVHKNSSWDMFSSTSLTEEGGERIICSSNAFVSGHLSVWFNPMLQAIQFPACIANLDTSLTNVDGYALALWEETGGTLVGCISGGFLKCKY